MKLKFLLVLFCFKKIQCQLQGLQILVHVLCTVCVVMTTVTMVMTPVCVMVLWRLARRTKHWILKLEVSCLYFTLGIKPVCCQDKNYYSNGLCVCSGPVGPCKEN